MPFEPVNVTSITRPYAPLDASFPGGYRVPSVKGGTITVLGCCFARSSPLTTVTVNGAKIPSSGVTVAADGNSVTVAVPALLATAAEKNTWTKSLNTPLELKVSNGNTPEARVAVTNIDQYVHAEDPADVVRHLEPVISAALRDGIFTATSWRGGVLRHRS